MSLIFVLLTSDGLALTDNRVLMTMVGGRVEYCTTSAAELCPGHANRPPALLPDTRPPVPVRWLTLLLFAVGPAAGMLVRSRLSQGWRRALGIGSILGGLVWLYTLLGPDWVSDALFILIFTVPMFLFGLGTIGLAVVQPGGKFSRFSLWLTMLSTVSVALGGVLMEWFRQDNAWFFFIIGILGHSLGLLLFGVSGLRDRTPLNLLALATGLLGGLIPFGLSFILPESSDLPFQMLLGGLGGGWFVMGGILLVQSRKR